MMDEAGEAPQPQRLLNDASFGGADEAEPTESGGKKFSFMRAESNLKNDGLPAYFAIHLAGARDHYLHIGKWSKFLMSAIGGMILFQSALLTLVGLGWLDFTQYEWLLPVLLVQNLGQIVGLALYAVRYLFSDISDQIPAPARNTNRDSS